MINMSPPIPFVLISNLIIEGLRILELSNLRRHFFWTCANAGRGQEASVVLDAYRGMDQLLALLLGSGMICRLLEGLAARRAHSPD